MSTQFQSHRHIVDYDIRIRYTDYEGCPFTPTHAHPPIPIPNASPPPHRITELPAPDASHPEPIAIVGMAMRLPGSIRSADDLWSFLMEKRDARSAVPSDRYNIDGFYGPNRGSGHVDARHGYFIQDRDLRDLDVSCFPMKRSEAEMLDPAQRLLLETVWECLENGGQVGFRGKDIGCFVGVFGDDWQEIQARDAANIGTFYVSGSHDFALSNRISWAFDLRGPSTTTKTACSSSLVALHNACQNLYSGDCSAAVVAGCNLLLTPTTMTSVNAKGVFACDGSCKTFDASANGYVRAEGVSAIFVKKLSDALRDGDPIRAVIRSTAINSDGQTPVQTCPSSEAQEALIRRAHEVAGLPVSQTAYVECHGTGTSVGDPIEARAIAKVFGEHGIVMGSIKPNLGHAEGASGLSSVIKAVLALEKKTIPPHIKFDTPNPNIPFKKAKLTVPTEPMPWPDSRAERVCVNSYGIGGSNAHVILDSAGSMVPAKRTPSSEPPTQPQLLVFSANHPDSLRRNIASLRSYIWNHPECISDLAYTLSVRRQHLAHRSFAIADEDGHFEPSPFVKASTPKQPVFVFSGQGAQWPQMARNLLESSPVFRQSLQKMNGYLRTIPEAPSWNIEVELLKPAELSRINNAEFSQPLCTAVQIALTDVLSSWGLHPVAVVGFSAGEIAAAYACGALTMQEAIVNAYYRGLVTRSITQDRTYDGGMVAVGLSPEAVGQYLVPGVAVACEIGPSVCTLSGMKALLDVVVTKIKQGRPEAYVKHLDVGIAYHSKHMKKVDHIYEGLLQKHIRSKAPSVPFYSTVTGQQITGDDSLSASYWRTNMVSRVRFPAAMQTILHRSAAESRSSVFIEIGPHSTLSGAVKELVAASGGDHAYVSTLIRHQPATKSLLNTAGQFYVHALELDFKMLMPRGAKVLTDLPNYQWHYDKKYWFESRVVRDWRFRQFPHHSLLGSRITEMNGAEPAWRNMLGLRDNPWIRDHLRGKETVFPVAGYVAMVGEAMRQLTGAEGYSVRRLAVKQELVLSEEKTTEVSFCLRPSSLYGDNSPWYEFSLYSYNGTGWVRHCVGQARGGLVEMGESLEIDTLPREVPMERWYRKLQRYGLRYGERLRCLEDVSACVKEKRAVATVKSQEAPNESFYTLHPAQIDAAIQLLAIATAKGSSTDCTRIWTPTYIGELSVQGAGDDGSLRFQALDKSPQADVACGEVVVRNTTDASVVLSMKELTLSPTGAGEENTIDDNPHGAVQLEWKPDVDMVADAASLVKSLLSETDNSHFKNIHVLIEELALLCIIECNAMLETLDSPASPHLAKFKSWLKSQTKSVAENAHSFLQDTSSYLDLSSSERQQLIRTKLVEATAHTESQIPALAISRVFEHCHAIILGKKEGIEVLHQDNLLVKLYDTFSQWEFGPFFDLLAHKNPRLRILEIGAGTGGTTAQVLEKIGGMGKLAERRYASYTFTDISAGFFVGAKERFKDVPGMEFKVLDVSRDPAEQGFVEGGYDLVVAANVIHATPVLAQSLENIRKLLKPGGRVFLQELCPESKWINYVMGILPGWWLGEGDNRTEEPYVQPNRWMQELLNAGFAAPSVSRGPLDAIIVAQPVHPSPTRERLTLVVGFTDSSPVLNHIKPVLESRGYGYDICTIYDEAPANQDVISLVDLEAPILDNLDEAGFKALKSLLLQAQHSSIVWITGSSQAECSDPRHSLILGLARTLRRKFSNNFVTVETSHFDSAVAETTMDLYHQFKRCGNDDLQSDPDFEFCIKGKQVHVGRFRPVSVADELSGVSHDDDVWELSVGKPGDLESVQWTARHWESLGDDQVLVDVRAVGLDQGQSLESTGACVEGSGVVLKVGHNVKKLNVGDRVMFLSNGCAATSVAVSEATCVKIPSDWGFADATSMPVAFGTAIYALMDRCHLTRGQTVLINSAACPVGIALIQICRMIGAEIYTTVGSESEGQYLVTQCGIPSHHVFTSANTAFSSSVASATNGQGVDVVVHLNTVSGELVETSWDALAPFGTFVDLSNKSASVNQALPLWNFLENKTFIRVDFNQIVTQMPSVLTRLLERCTEYLRLGFIQPIPSKTFQGSHVKDAFHWLQRQGQTSKIIVEMSRSRGELPARTTKKQLSFRPDVSYLLVGGLGGLGRGVAVWMAQNGARNFIFLSRSADSAGKHRRFIEELDAMGCAAQVFAGDVSNMSDVQRVFEEASKPIAGIMQLSMAVRERPFSDMTFDDWQAATRAKVQGTWNLHEASQAQDLDFFLLFSSLAGTFGNWNEAGYSAASTFLDAFVQYRNQAGLPASVVDIGLMGDIGYVSENAELLDRFNAASMYNLREKDLFEILQLLITRSIENRQSPRIDDGLCFTNKNQLAIGVKSLLPLDAPDNLTIWKRDAAVAFYRNTESQQEPSTGTTRTSDSERLKDLLASITASPTTIMSKSNVDQLALEIRATLGRFMLQADGEVDLMTPLPQLGVDSMVAIEARNWLQTALGVQFRMSELLRSSIVGLSERALKKIAEKQRLK